MVLSFVNYFPVNLSVKTQKNLNGMKFVKSPPKISSFFKNVPKIKTEKKTTLFENKQNNYSKKYISWLSENNVYVSSKSTWGRPPHPCVISDETTDEGEPSGRGMIAFKNIQQNDKVVEIPENIIITEENDFFYSKSFGILNEYDRLAMFLIRERAKGNKSFWKPYFDKLPFENDLKLVFRWKLSDLIFLKGSKILLATTYLKKKIDFQFFNLHEKIFRQNPLSFPEETFNLKSWEWAMTILFSRAIYLPNSKKIALVPYADLLNHNPFSTSYIDSKSIPFSNSFEISMYSDRSYNKFDQIYTTYGPKTNLELLILYGFSLERNPFEAYEIRVSLSSNDRKYSEKKNFIKDCGKTNEITFPIFLYQYPKELYEFMSFCLLSEGDFSNHEDYFFEGQTNDDSKKTNVIKKSLAYVCRKNLMKYPLIRNEENVLNLSFDTNHISKNQRISLKQRKIEKKILIKLTEFK